MFPEHNYVVLNRDINVSFFLNEKTGELKAKSIHKLTHLILKDDVDISQLFQVPFSKYETVKVHQAKIFKLDSLGRKRIKENIKVKHAKVKDYLINNIFYHDLRVVDFHPSVDVNSDYLITVSYEIIYHNLMFLNRFYLQNQNEAVVKSRFSIQIPDYVESELVSFNLDENRFARDEKTNGGLKTISIRFNPENTLRNSELHPPKAYLMPHVVVLCKRWTHNNETHEVLSSIDGLYKWYKSLLNDLKPENDYLSKLSKTIVPEEINDRQKISSIFNWVQDHINYVAFEDGIAGFKPEEAHTVALLMYGDCKGMANLLISLLRLNGIEAYHTWVGTKSIPYNYSIPSLIVDNHMICTVRLNDSLYYLDATDPSIEWNDISSGIEGQTALIDFNDHYELVNIPKQIPEHRKITMIATIDLPDKIQPQIKGRCELSNNNKQELEAGIILSPIKYHDLVIWNFIGEYIDGLLINSTSIEYQNDFNKIEFSSNINPVMAETGNKVYLFNEYFELYNTIIDHATETPVYFKEGYMVNYHVKIKLPSNYSIVSMPSEMKYESDDQAIKFDYSFSFTSGELDIKSGLTINKNMITQQEEWQVFYNHLSDFVKQPIVFNP